MWSVAHFWCARCLAPEVPLLMQVVLQRLCLVTQAGLTPHGSWLQSYTDLLRSPGGEYIQSDAGERLLGKLLDKLPQSNTACPVELRDNRLAVCDPRVLWMVRFVLYCSTVCDIIVL